MKNRTLYCLVVEDEPLAQEIMENYIARLSKLKLVAKCETVQEALKIISSQEVDIIFVDLDLKINNGLEIISEIKAGEGKPYYIVITSASSVENFKSKALVTPPNIHFIDFLSKPFSFNRFLEAVEKIIALNNQTE